jgi:hypothetical protein
LSVIGDAESGAVPIRWIDPRYYDCRIAARCFALARVAWSAAAVERVYCRPPRTDVIRCVLNPSQCIRPT